MILREEGDTPSTTVMAPPCCGVACLEDETSKCSGEMLPKLSIYQIIIVY